jgi:hypothetical protein
VNGQRISEIDLEIGLPSMNRLLIVAILFISMASLYAQAQQPNTAKLKADAQNALAALRKRYLPALRTYRGGHPGSHKRRPKASAATRVKFGRKRPKHFSHFATKSTVVGLHRS